jgi:hypothetical protein
MTVTDDCCLYCGGELTVDTLFGPYTTDHSLCLPEYYASIPEEDLVEAA